MSEVQQDKASYYAYYLSLKFIEVAQKFVQVFHKFLQKNLNELLGQPNTTPTKNTAIV